METPPLSLRTGIFLLSLSLLIYGGAFISSELNKKTTIVFCDVGQGDGAYIRLENKIDILVDAGPQKQILACLGKYMPFYDRTIELAFLSHPQKDHYGGYLFLLDRYRIETFVSVPLQNPSSSFSSLLEKLKVKKVRVKYLYAGDRVRILSATIVFLWPEESFIAYQKALNKNPDPNIFSQIFIFSYSNVRILFTGDGTQEVLQGFSKRILPRVAILKVPHHGSQNGLTRDFLDLANPVVAVISSGKNNPYGHPSKKVLDFLKAKKIKIRRTDYEGDIVFENIRSFLEEYSGSL